MIGCQCFILLFVNSVKINTTLTTNIDKGEKSNFILRLNVVFTLYSLAFNIVHDQNQICLERPIYFAKCTLLNSNHLANITS